MQGRKYCSHSYSGCSRTFVRKFCFGRASNLKTISRVDRQIGKHVEEVDLTNVVHLVVGGCDKSESDELHASLTDPFTCSDIYT